jgi:hypothetical protein
VLPSRARSPDQASGGNRSLGQGRNANGRESQQDSERVNRAFPCYRLGSAGFVRSRSTRSCDAPIAPCAKRIRHSRVSLRCP